MNQRIRKKKKKNEVSLDTFWTHLVQSYYSKLHSFFMQQKQQL